MKSKRRLISVWIATLFCLGSAQAKQVKLEVSVSHPILLAGVKQTAYVKVGLTGQALTTTKDRAPVNVAMVLDRSGSMGGEKIRRARDAAIMAIDRLGRNDIVSVVAYNSGVQVLVPATKVSDKHSIFAAIRGLTAGGSTALFAGVSKGAAEVGKFLQRNQVNRVVLLSDGLANVGPSSPSALGELGASLIKEGISVTTIGLGLGYNEDLMLKLAMASDGNHAFVEGPEQLARIFNYEFGDLLSVVANDVAIEIVCSAGVRPVRVLGREATIIGQRITTRLNQIYGRQEKYLLLEVEMAAAAAGRTRAMASVAVDYIDMIHQGKKHLSQETSVTYSSSAQLVRANTNAQVMVAAVEQIGNLANRQAVALRDQGKIKEARKLLLGNEAYLIKNANRYKSKRLKDHSKANRVDFDNLDSENWGRQRKHMNKRMRTIRGQQAW